MMWVFAAVFSLHACNQNNLKDVRDEQVILKGTAWFSGSPLVDHTVHVYPYSANIKGPESASRTTSDTGSFEIDLGLEDGAYLVEVENPATKQVVLRTYVYAFPTDNRDASPVHLHVLSQWQGAYYKYLIDQKKLGSIAANTQAATSFMGYVGFDPQKTRPGNVGDAKSPATQLRAYLDALPMLGTILAKRANPTSPGYAVDAIRDAVERDLAGDGIANGKSGKDKIYIGNVALASDVLRIEMGRAIQRWLASPANALGLTKDSEASWIKDMATRQGGAFPETTAYFDVDPPVLSLKDLPRYDLVWPSLKVLCEATDGSKITDMQMYFEYSNKTRAALNEIVVPDGEDSLERREIILDPRVLAYNDITATIVCSATDIFEQTSTLRVPVRYNASYGEIDFREVLSDSSDPARLTCACPDVDTSCRIVSGPLGTPIPEGSAENYVAYAGEDKNFRCERPLAHEHSCVWRMGSLPTDDVVPGVVCKISSPGLDDAQKSTSVSPDIYAEGHVTVQAHIGFPIVGADVTAWQVQPDGSRGREIGACAGNGRCLTDEQGRVVLRLRDLSTATESYSGVIEINVLGGSTQAISAINASTRYTSSPSYSTLIAYQPKRRTLAPNGSNLGTVVVNAETSLAAAFSRGIKQKENIPLYQAVHRAHLLLAQRLLSCTCLLKDPVTKASASIHPYNDPAGACFIDFNDISEASSSALVRNYVHGSADIRHVVPSSLATISSFSDSFADRLALLHVGYQLRTDTYLTDSVGGLSFVLNNYIEALSSDALDGIWNKRRGSTAVGVIAGTLFKDKEYRSLLSKQVSNWLFRQARLDIATYSQPVTGFLPNLMQCSNALFDPTEAVDEYDWRNPKITMSRPDGDAILRSKSITVRVDTSDEDTRVEYLEFSVRQSSSYAAVVIGNRINLPSSTNTYTVVLPVCAARTTLIATAYDSAGRTSTAEISNIACDDIKPIFMGFSGATMRDHTSTSVSFDVNGNYVHSSINRTAISWEALESSGLSFVTFVDLAGDPDHVPHLVIANSPEPVSVDYAFTPFGMASAPLGWQTTKSLTSGSAPSPEIILTVAALCGDQTLCQEALIKQLSAGQFHRLRVRVRDAAGNTSETEQEVRIFSQYRFPPVRVSETRWNSALLSLRSKSSFIPSTLFKSANYGYVPFVEQVVDFPISASAGWDPAVISLHASHTGDPFRITFNEYRTGTDYKVIQSSLKQPTSPCVGASTNYGNVYWRYSDTSGNTWPTSCTTNQWTPISRVITVKSTVGRPAIFHSESSTVFLRGILAPGRSGLSMGWGTSPAFFATHIPDGGADVFYFFDIFAGLADPIAGMQITQGDAGPRINVPSYDGPAKIQSITPYYTTNSSLYTFAGWNTYTYQVHAESSKMTISGGSHIRFEHRIQGQINATPAVLYTSTSLTDIIVQ